MTEGKGWPFIDWSTNGWYGGLIRGLEKIASSGLRVAVGLSGGADSVALFFRSLEERSSSASSRRPNENSPRG